MKSYREFLYSTTKMSAPKEFKFEVVCLTLGKASPFEERPYQCQQEQILSGKNVPEKLYFIKKFFFKGRERRREEESRPEGRRQRKGGKET